MTSSPIIWLEDDHSGAFPDPSRALSEPDGLLAAGGNLEADTLLQAYSQGIFPWYSHGQPILWWSPDPRCVLYPNEFHVSRSFRRTLNSDRYQISVNTAFRRVVEECAAPRPDQHGTWITRDMLDAYCRLHELGHATSVEVWDEHWLIGGIYGVVLNDVFFGESMFSREANTSKLAIHHICTEIKPRLLDAQVYSSHLESLGARNIPRKHFIELIASSEF